MTFRKLILLAGLTLAACRSAAPAPLAPTLAVITPTPRGTDATPGVSTPTPRGTDAMPGVSTATPPGTDATPRGTDAMPGVSTPGAGAALRLADYALLQVAEGLTEPLFLTHAGDERLFVVEQPGAIRVIVDGELRAEPFLDLRARVNDSANEQGLLGLAFHPDYAANGWLFVNYTDAAGDTIIARFTVSADPDRADPASEQRVLKVDQPYGNHNGGHLAFGPDGYLYIGLGDGGSGGDPENRAQDLSTLLGKMLRIDVDGGEGYRVPDDNPFVNQKDAAPEIWSFGLRNPWRYAFDRLTGDLYLGDVGQGEIEEINFQPAASPGGENYGWRFLEGSQPYTGEAPPGTTLPAAEYAREGGCSVTGGYVYRGAALPALYGVYLFGDYCSGRLWTLQRDAAGAWTRAEFGETEFTLSSFGEDAAGELYVLDHRGGGVYQLVAHQP